LSAWRPSNVVNMESMFAGATSFNSDLSKWPVSKCEDMSRMFENASSFNYDLSEWDVWEVDDFTLTFGGASSFDQSLCWEIHPLAKVEGMFEGTDGANAHGCSRSSDDSGAFSFGSGAVMHVILLGASAVMLWH